MANVYLMSMCGHEAKKKTKNWTCVYPILRIVQLSTGEETDEKDSFLLLLCVWRPRSYTKVCQRACSETI